LKNKLTVFLFFFFITVLSLFLSGCAKDETEMKCLEAAPVFDGRPAILIIGDSISGGYYPYIQQALPNYQVIRHECNARNSRFTKANIDRWLSYQNQWHAITFNNALWDNADFARVYDEEYLSNMSYIADAIKAKTSRPLYILGTYVPVNTPYRSDGRQLYYNAIAQNIMTNKSIPIVDLYSVSYNIQHLYESATAQDDVHFIDAGSQALANEILTRLNAEYGVN